MDKNNELDRSLESNEIFETPAPASPILLLWNEFCCQESEMDRSISSICQIP